MWISEKLEKFDSYGNGTIAFENCYVGDELITEDNVNELFDISDEVTVVVNND